MQCQAVIFALYRPKVQMSTPFLRGRPWNSAHVFNVSLPKLLRMAFPVFFVVFFAGNVGSLKTQISQKPERAKYLAKKKDKVKTQFVKGSARAHQTRLQNFRVYMDSEGIWGLCLNQPVLIVGLFQGDRTCLLYTSPSPRD